TTTGDSCSSHGSIFSVTHVSDLTLCKKIIYKNIALICCHFSFSALGSLVLLFKTLHFNFTRLFFPPKSVTLKVSEFQQWNQRVQQFIHNELLAQGYTL